MTKGKIKNKKREQKSLGGLAKLASKGIKSLIKELSPQVRKKNKSKVDDIESKIENLERAYNDTFLPEDSYPLGGAPNKLTLEKRREEIIDRMNRLSIELEEITIPRVKKEEGGDIDAQMETLMPTHTMPDGTEMPGATHEEYEQTMSTDEDMEDGYLDFILDEALEDEEETYLMEQLESNDRLSLIFDKVVDVATEFAGSGPVEGPGSGVSDSIPARLSDGEFVITAKATEEIGVDNLEAMMKEAEAQADERQELNLGGKPIREEEEMEVDQFGKPIDSNVVDDEIRKGMLSANPRLK